MSKALVLSGTNFATNKLTTVSFITPKPCTGITVTSDTMSLTEEGEEETIGYTLTPNDTTDEVSISSSNANIVAIENGKAVSKGVGTATITITCGEQSATITVTSTFIMARNFKEQYSLSLISGYSHSLYDGTAAYWGYCGAEEPWGDERCIARWVSPYIPVYKIPTGCTSISIDVPNDSWKSIICFFDSTQKADNNENDLAYMLSMDDSAVAGDRTITTIPEGADSIAVSYRAPNITFDKDDLTGYNVTFA